MILVCDLLWGTLIVICVSFVVTCSCQSVGLFTIMTWLGVHGS